MIQHFFIKKHLMASSKHLGWDVLSDEECANKVCGAILGTSNFTYIQFQPLDWIGNCRIHLVIGIVLVFIGSPWFYLSI
jgi:hypothetical protein